MRSIAALVLLVLVAAVGVVVVHELTRSMPPEPIAPIKLEPAVQGGEAAEDDEPTRRQRRARGRDGSNGFAAQPAQRSEPDDSGAPDTPPPQIEVLPPDDTESDDGGDG